MSELGEATRPRGDAADDRQTRRREAIRRLVAAAAVPAVVATMSGNARPARAE